MKRIKKIASLLLALVMVVAMSIPAMAAPEEAPEYKITITNKNGQVSIAGNKYTAYKIFSATYNVETDTIAYTYDDTCLKGLVYKGMDAEGVLEWLSEVKEGTKESARTADQMREFADHVYENYIKGNNVTGGISATVPEESETVDIDVKEAGYYLVFGTANGTDGGSTVTAAVALTSAHPSETVNPKLDAPSLNKEIKDDDSGEWGVVSDHQIGDTVEFHTISTVPDINGYNNYTYIIHDTMSDSLDFDAGSVKIMINDKTELNKKYYSVAIDSQNVHKFTIDVDIMQAITDKVLTTTDELYTYYNATLNGAAVVYDEGNQNNAAYLEYSNNPYDDSTGTTQEKKVYDWTFKMGVQKIADDTEQTQLEGAKFVLSTKSGLNVTLTDDTENTLSSTDDLIGLTVKDGVYTIAGKDAKTDDIKYVIEAGNTTIKGLDDDTTYYLYEVKAPNGYNMLTDPVAFKITEVNAYGDDGNTKPTPEATITQEGTSLEHQALLAQIVNKAGVVLPSTGGIGTTIFYVLGGILVLGAAITLITKKRMSAE